MADFDINELCDRADVTPRTVHFYVQQGLLPPAGTPGPGARYTDGHVSRIKLIRLLQKQHLPLSEIAKRTKALTDEQVNGLIAETKQRRTEGRGTALDYVRSVLSESRVAGNLAAGISLQAVDSRDRLRQPSSTPMAHGPARSQWERFTLAEGMELHIRRPLSRVEQRQFEKLMAAARQIFDDSEGEAQS